MPRRGLNVEDGGQIFQVYCLNTTLARFRPNEIHGIGGPSPSARKFSPDIRQLENVNVFDRLEIRFWRADFSSNCEA